MSLADPGPRRRLRPALAFLIGVLAAGVSSGANGVDDALASIASSLGQGRPLVRIGLDQGPMVLVSSLAPYRVLDPATGSDVWRASYDGELAIVAEGAPKAGIATVYRVQVGAYSTREAAEAEKTALARRYSVPGVVHYVPDRGTWRVRLGRAEGRERLSGLVDRLRADGREGIWIAEEPETEASGVTLRLVDTRTYESRAVPLRRLAMVPGKRAARVDGTPYRGVIELRVSPFGLVRAVNWVELESYLRGVVPAELGPEVWPRLEALKAQTVAARTYVVRNLGQFEDEGFDLCSTPRCQVYKGIDAEHHLSDRAIRATAKEVLVWNGRPINSLFTATCGGHTEDAANVFAEEKAPYLIGVPCRTEPDALHGSRVVLSGRDPARVKDESGRDRSRAWALLRASGVLQEQDTASSMGKVMTSKDVQRWAKALSSAAGRAEPAAVSRRLPTVAAACSLVLDALGWRERADVLLSELDLSGILRSEDDDTLEPDERRAAAYLAMEGLLERGSDGTLGLRSRPIRSRFLPILLAAITTYEVDDLRTATFLGVEDGLLHLFRGKSEIRVPRSEEPFLFDSTASGSETPAARLDLYPGDRLRYRTNGSGQVAFLELVPPVNGFSDDRLAKLHSWTERVSGRTLEEAINRRVDVGVLRDLRVLRRGVSGRIAELAVEGDRGRDVVQGFDIRRLLGIRESLAVFEIQRDASGRVDAVVFSGKGWGHGVGLCQVGAYGMALRGVGYREILGHYYRGATLAPIDDDGRVPVRADPAEAR